MVNGALQGACCDPLSARWRLLVPGRHPPSLELSTLVADVDLASHPTAYPKGQTIFTQGEPADAVFYIAKGRVKITVISPQGKEAVVAILGPDDFFGEGCLAGQPRRMATVRS